MMPIDWQEARASLDAFGYATLRRLVSPADCQALAESFETDSCFRNRVVMQRHGYGQGEYRYFSYPLPALVQSLRSALYKPLAAIARDWGAALGASAPFPASHADFLAQCHAAGQTRPTPLLLRYDAGDYNRLHQDLYGDTVFPLQATVLLSRPGEDFAGGAFVLTEQRPRSQSRVEVVALDQGDAVIFAVNHRPASGPRGVSRVAMRHGVSRILAGRRYAMGIIFHDAA